jgi:hypothetical protein
MTRTATIAAALAALLAPAVAVAAGTSGTATYSFTKIADTADGFSSFGCPALNGRGQAAFGATVFDPETFNSTESVERGSGGPLTTIADEGDDFSFFGNPSINRRGSVSVAARFDEQEGEAIVRGRGGPLTEIARTDPGRFNFFTFDTSVNNDGVVAFTAELDERFDFDEGLFTGDGGPPRTRYLASTSRFQGSIAPPSINEHGEVAFAEQRDDDVRGIFRQSDGRFTTIADDRGRFQGFTDRPSLNNDGWVAFTAFHDETPDQFVLVGRGRALDVRANTRGEYQSFGDPSLNDRDRVAFSAELDTFDDEVGAFEQGLFRGRDPVDDAVIRSGDRLFGSRVTGLTACREALNSFGQIAFRAQLADGREVIARANRRR